jgi:uncharacterized phage protein gp47/JayE
MATLNTKGFSDLLADQAAAIQGASTRANLDFSVGSVLRALAEGWASVALWLQALVLRVAGLTRLATSSGADADSFVGDFGVTRLAATAASGLVTFSRLTTTSQAVVPVGALVKSSDGAWTYAVALDATRAAYSAAAGGYVIPSGSPNVTVPVRAVTTGAGGNAAAGGVSLIASAIPFVDAVTNGLALTGGADAETDTALRARFVAYIGSLSKATAAAVGYAISQVQPGLTYSIIEGTDPSGNPQLGYFYVVVDDGTGAPSTSLIALVAAAVEAVRPLGITYAVIAPTPVTASVSYSLTLAAGAVRSAEIIKANAALVTYLNSLGMGDDLPYTRLAQVIYDASPNIIGVSSLTLNSGTADLITTARQVVVPGTMTGA